MTLIEALEKRKRCPQDGAMLQGKLGLCRVCGSTWFPLLDGTAGESRLNEPFENRDYLRRKLSELDAHRLRPGAPPPRAASRFGVSQGGLGLGGAFGPAMPRSVDVPVLGRVYR